MADVIFGFDVDACQLAYDGKRVLATPSAKRALTSGVNIADPERSTASYETRLYKYALRGFAVGVPGLDMSRVDPALRNAIFTFDTGQLMHDVQPMRFDLIGRADAAPQHDLWRVERASRQNNFPVGLYRDAFAF